MSPSLTTNSVPLEFETISVTDIEGDRLLMTCRNRTVIYFTALLLNGISGNTLFTNVTHG